MEASNSRAMKLARSAGMRLSSLCCVLEGIEDGGDRAAFMRTAEAFGILHVHEIITDNTIRAHQLNGAEKWLVVSQHASSAECVSAIADDFALQIVDVAAGDDDNCTEEAREDGAGAMGVSSAGTALQDVQFNQPTALVFSGKGGASKTIQEAATGSLRIPLSGFGQTLTQRVSAALVMHWSRHARTAALQAQGGLNESGGDLPPGEVEALLQLYRSRGRGFKKNHRRKTQADLRAKTRV